MSELPPGWTELGPEYWQAHPLANTDRILILGDSLSGKTYMARSFLKRYRRVVVITPQPDEFKDYPNRLVTMDKEKVFDTISTALEEGNIMIVIDDSDILLEKIESDQRFGYFVKGGRHRGDGYTIISRRTADIPTMCAKQANKWFLFQTDLPHDIKFLNDFCYPAGEKVRGLDRSKHECLYVDRDAKVMGIITA